MASDLLDRDKPPKYLLESSAKLSTSNVHESKFKKLIKK
jgi:hypothetical protein